MSASIISFFMLPNPCTFINGCPLSLASFKSISLRTQNSSSKVISVLFTIIVSTSAIVFLSLLTFSPLNVNMAYIYASIYFAYLSFSLCNILPSRLTSIYECQHDSNIRFPLISIFELSTSLVFDILL